MDINEQVRIIEAQINSEHANFSLVEKMAYINQYFKPDPEFSDEAIQKVIHHICLGLKENDQP